MSETHNFAHEREVRKERRVADIRAWETKASRQGFLWYAENNGLKESGFSEDVKEMLPHITTGKDFGHVLHEKPPTGEFVYVEDKNDKASEEAVVCYERQIVKTKRDIVSPEFSSCAGVVLYKVGEGGSPSKETIFAHLPPKVYSELTGRPADFNDYTPAFFAEKMGVSNLDGYSAKIIAGLKTSPDAIVSSLKALGVDVVSVDQIPRDMYTAMVSHEEKRIAIAGKVEKMAEKEHEPISYRTEDGIPIIISEDLGIAIID